MHMCVVRLELCSIMDAQKCGLILLKTTAYGGHKATSVTDVFHGREGALQMCTVDSITIIIALCLTSCTSFSPPCKPCPPLLLFSQLS